MSAAVQTIELKNPVADHYETWIMGNAVAWQVRAMVELEELIDDPAIYAELMHLFEAHRPGLAFAESQVFHDYVAPFAKRYVPQQDECKGEHLVICGAGPSLRQHADDYCAEADDVWGCNSALTWLHDNGYRVTHGFTVDQTPHMVAEWASCPDVDYLVASTVHPNLLELLNGKGRSVRWFHNFVGIKKPPVSWPDANGEQRTLPYEDWLYALLFPTTIRAGSGLNSVTRAIDVAKFLGYEKITVLGADCCLQVKGAVRTDLEFGSKRHLRWLKTHTTMHADGGHALASEATPVVMAGKIDGRMWLTKPDMVISAQWLARMARDSNGQIELVGDTLPNALKDKDDAFFARLPNFTMTDGRVVTVSDMMQGA